jgi:hypothetical protein
MSGFEGMLVRAHCRLFRQVSPSERTAPTRRTAARSKPFIMLMAAQPFAIAGAAVSRAFAFWPLSQRWLHRCCALPLPNEMPPIG